MLRLKHRLAPRAAEQFADNSRAIGRIQNREILFVANVLRFFAQNPHPQRMKRAHGQAARLLAPQPRQHALLHFFRRLVGERNRRDVVRLVARLRNHVGDFFSNDARFAAARARQHK